MSEQADLGQLREALAELEGHLAQAGPVGDLPAGLDPEQSRQLAHAEGLRLTDELVELFAWHDGFGTFPTPMHSAPGSLAHSFEQTRMMREELAPMGAPELQVPASEIWAPHWYAFQNVWGFEGGPVFDLSVPPSAPTPVFGLGWGDVEVHDILPAFTSLTGLVAAWNLHLSIGHDLWNADLRRWERNKDVPSPFANQPGRRTILA